MEALWPLVLLAGIFAAWDSVRRIFWAKSTRELDARLKLMEDELPALRKTAGDAESFAKTVSNRLESAPAKRSGQWMRP